MFYDLRIDRFMDAVADFHIARVAADLPGVRRRDHDVPADELAPVHVVPKGCRQEADPVAARAEQLIGLLENGYAGPFEIPGIDGDVFLLGQHLQPVVEPSDHDGADRTHRGDVFSLALPPLEATLHRFRDGDTLRQREADGGVDADAAVGGFFNGRNTGTRDRNLYDHIGCQAVEFLGLLNDRGRIAVQPRIGLNGETPVPAALGIEDWLQPRGTLPRHLAHQVPANLVFSGSTPLFAP